MANTKYLNQVKLTATVTPSNTAIAAGNDGQVVAQNLQGQINYINSTSSAAYAADIVGGIANDIPYQTAANVTSFITPVNSAVLISSVAGVPSMATTLPAVGIGTCTVTDPKTAGSASINTALSDVYGAIPSVSYPIAINNGGTGQTTAQLAMNALAGAVTTKYYLRGDNTNVTMSAIQAADVPTLNQSTSGTAANVTGTVAIANGGTGQTTQQLALNAIAGAVTTKYYLRGDNTNVTMSAIQAADVPTLNQSTSGTAANVTGIVALANGGTAANLTANNGGIFYSTASAGAILSGTATAKQVLVSGASTTPAWSTATYPTTTTVSQILYSSSANAIAGLATANSGTLVTSSTGIPSIIAAGTTGQFLSASTAGTPGWSTATYPTSTTISRILYSSAANTVSELTTANNGVLLTNGTGVPSIGTATLAVGGTSNSLSASAGGVVWSDASKLNILAGTATANQLLLSGASATPVWSTSTYPTTNAVSTLLYASSANVMSALATGNSGTLITDAGGIPSISSTLPSTVQGNITKTGALASGSLAAGFTAVTVPLGGTGVSTTTAYGVVCGGTTTTAALQNAGAGTTGQVLTSQGATAIPTWANSSAVGGLVLIASSAPSAQTSVTFSGLGTGYIYKLVYSLYQNTTAGQPTLIFNNDSGGGLYYYESCYFVGGSYGSSDINAAFIGLTNSTDTVTVGTAFTGEYTFSTVQGATHDVTIQGTRGYNSAAILSMMTGIYLGSATLSSMKITTTAGTFTGIIRLYAYE
jgi:DNA-binding transcriptional regulator YdaS (Cro superfamily)